MRGADLSCQLLTSITKDRTKSVDEIKVASHSSQTSIQHMRHGGVRRQVGLA